MKIRSGTTGTGGLTFLRELGVCLTSMQVDAAGSKDLTLPELGKTAEVIIMGAVNSIEDSGEARRSIVRVLKVVRGRADDLISVVGLPCAGGEARFREDENVLLFLTPVTEKGAFTCVHGAAGKFSYLPEEYELLYLLADKSAGRDDREFAAYELKIHYEELLYFIENPLSDRRILGAILRELEEAGADNATGSCVKDTVADGLLLAWLRDERMDPLVHSWSVKQLACRGVKSAVADIALRSLCIYPHQLRLHALAALGDLGSPGQVPTLLGALNDGEPDIREGAAHALGALQYPDTMAVKKLADRFEKETNTFVRLAIVSSLESTPGDDARKALRRIDSVRGEECVVSLTGGVPVI